MLRHLLPYTDHPLPVLLLSFLPYLVCNAMAREHSVPAAMFERVPPAQGCLSSCLNGSPPLPKAHVGRAGRLAASVLTLLLCALSCHVCTALMLYLTNPPPLPPFPAPPAGLLCRHRCALLGQQGAGPIVHTNYALLITTDLDSWHHVHR
jgi:hypothetical protein